MQTLFLLFCAGMFYVIQLKLNFLKEIVLLPLLCVTVKDCIHNFK
jgi:hypothetical protein